MPIRIAALAFAVCCATLLAGCTAPAAQLPTPTPTLGGGVNDPSGGSGADNSGRDFMPLGEPPCDRAEITDFGFTSEKLPVEWPAAVPILYGPCFNVSVTEGHNGGYSYAVSIAFVDDTDELADNWAWISSNGYLLGDSFEAITADEALSATAISSSYRNERFGTDGDVFYNYELLLALERPSGKDYVVLTYLLNFANY